MVCAEKCSHKKKRRAIDICNKKIGPIAAIWWRLIPQSSNGKCYLACNTLLRAVSTLWYFDCSREKTRQAEVSKWEVDIFAWLVFLPPIPWKVKVPKYITWLRHGILAGLSKCDGTRAFQIVADLKWKDEKEKFCWKQVCLLSILSKHNPFLCGNFWHIALTTKVVLVARVWQLSDLGKC